MQFTFTFSALNIGLLLYWILIYLRIFGAHVIIFQQFCIFIYALNFSKELFLEEKTVCDFKGQRKNHCPDKEVLLLDQGFQKLNIVIMHASICISLV